ncbi:MAG: FHA domain-containing protein [Planctomycetaceae bacterium]|nr:FHA domain-containing protein [Planctomycetaceae bacterium]
MQVARSDRRRRWYLRWRSLLARPLQAVPMSLTPATSGTAATSWNRFRHDCRIPDGVSLTLSRRDGCRIVVPLCDPYTLVGRGSHCTVRLDDPAVADVQAAFVWVEGRLFLIDAHRSSFGSLETLASPVWRWGRWTTEVVGLPPTNAKRRAVLPGHQAVLDLAWNDTGPARPTRLSRPLTVIGSAALCSVRLAHPGVVSLHAAFVRTETAVWLVNLAEPGVTRVNGRSIEFAPLDPGDVINIGPVTATFTAHWSEAAATSSPQPDASMRLSEQQARIAELEARLTKLKQMTNGTAHVEQQLDAIQQLAAECEQWLDPAPAQTFDAAR